MSHPDLFPRLGLVPTDRVRFHEQPERRRTLHLVERLRTEGRLRNPPIVAEMGEDDYLLLDGANRVSAFRELGLPEIPAQLVEYASPEIELRGWHHLLLDPSALDLEAAYHALPGIRVHSLAGRALARALEFREVYAVWVDRGARAWGLFPAQSMPALGQRMRVLTEIITCYERDSPLERIKLASYDELPAVIERHPYELCLFPSLTKEELLQLVRQDQLIPTGITRHLIPGRALGLGIDLDFLTALTDPAARREHLQRHLDALELNGRIRYYEEPVFIMNE